MLSAFAAWGGGACAPGLGYTPGVGNHWCILAINFNYSTRLHAEHTTTSYQMQSSQFTLIFMTLNFVNQFPYYHLFYLTLSVDGSAHDPKFMELIATKYSQLQTRL